MEKLSGSLQGNLLVLLCWDRKSFQLIRNAVPVNLFTTDVYRNIIQKVYGYIDQFKKPPEDHLADLLEDELSSKSRDLYKAVIIAVREERKSTNSEYILNQLEHFVRLQNLKLGVIKASDAIAAGRSEDAEVELEKALKERLSLFKPGMTLAEALKVLKANEGKLREPLPLGITELDKIGAAPARKELLGFLGPKKAGKTWWLIHLAKRGLLVNQKVAAVSLEVGELLYSARIIQSLYALSMNEAKRVAVTRFERDELGRVGTFSREEMEAKSLLTVEGRKVASRGLDRYSANLRIKEFPTRSLGVSGLKAYLDALDRMEHFTPDLLLVDYPGIMKVDSDNMRISLGEIIADLRGLAGERNMAVAVVGQVNREGVKAGTTSGTHAAEDFSINMTADVVLTYSQTPAEYQLGLARLGVDASRISKQHVSVMISQAYDLGQFCLDSAPIASWYQDTVKETAAKETPTNQEEDE